MKFHASGPWGNAARPPHNFLVRPGRGHVSVQPYDHVQVVVEDGETADRNRENLGESRSRSSIHCFRFDGPSPSKNARRTQCEMLWYQSVTDGSTSRACHRRRVALKCVCTDYEVATPLSSDDAEFPDFPAPSEDDFPLGFCARGQASMPVLLGSIRKKKPFERLGS
jgi:hypothetical protein